MRNLAEMRRKISASGNLKSAKGLADHRSEMHGQRRKISRIVMLKPNSHSIPEEFALDPVSEAAD
jgi:hypothetical protein